MGNEKMKERVKTVALASAPMVCAMLCLFFWKIYDNKVTLIVPPCLAWALLHRYCPGCGGTRAVRYLVCGDLASSLRCHPAPVLGVIILLLWWTELILKRFGKEKKIIPRNGWFWYSVLGMFLLWCVLRNFIPALAPIPLA